MHAFIHLFRLASRLASTTTITEGATATPQYRVFFKDGEKTISPWHDIPLKSGEYFNFIAEIPK